MKTLRANTLKDHANFFLHFGLAGAATTGVFFALGCPPVLGAIAVGLTVGLHGGLMPFVKNGLQDAINEERNMSLNGNRFFHQASDPASVPRNGRRISFLVQQWTDIYAQRFGMDSSPNALVMPPPNPLDEIAGRKAPGFRGFLRDTFNKHANAFAFQHDHGHVVLTDPIVKTLDEKALQGVVAHEVGHLAAGHAGKRELIAMIAGPGRILAGLGKFVTVVSSFKNAGLYVGANMIAGVGSAFIAGMQHLDEEDAKDKVQIATYRKFIHSVAIAGLAVVFQAPDLLIAEGLNFMAREGSNLIQKRYSRCNEFQADRLAAQVTGDPAGLSRGLESLRRHALQSEPGFNFDREVDRKEKGFLSSLFDTVRDLGVTHPNVDRRTNRLRAMPTDPLAWQPV